MATQMFIFDISLMANVKKSVESTIHHELPSDCRIDFSKKKPLVSSDRKEPMFRMSPILSHVHTYIV